MSLDLDWSLLDRALCDKLIAKLNHVLENATRPDFLGPISVEEFDAGEEGPELEIIGIQDIWSEFLLDQEDHLQHHRHNGSNLEGQPQQQAWRPPPTERHGRRDPPPNLNLGSNHPRHQRDDKSPEADSRPSSRASQSVKGIGTSVASAGLGPAGIFSHWQARQHAANGGKPYLLSHTGALNSPLSPSHLTIGIPPPPYPYGPRSTAPPTRNPSFSSRAPFSPHPYNAPLHDDISSVPPVPSEIPSLQIKTHVRWQTTSIRLTLKTSVLINQPCFMFMELPLQLTLTGLVLDGTLLIAVEGAKKRLHISLLDEGHEDATQKAAASQNNEADSSAPVILTATDSRPRSQQPASVQSFGARLLPFLTFESSVGEEEKHMLRNVGKVEKFVSELVRKVVEDEVSRIAGFREEDDSTDGVCIAACVS
jgi:mitochondrial distribution and morphology protein 12